MPSLITFAKEQTEKLNAQNRLRSLRVTTRTDGIYVVRDGKKLISFSCNDYLGLTFHHEVTKAACDATIKYGAGSAASRLVTGNSSLYAQLESLLAKIKGTESSLVFGSGFLANIGIISSLVGKGDLIIADKLVHASIIDGAKLSGAKLIRFAHNDAVSCHKLLKKHRASHKNCLIITETIFSMDGDIAPIDELYELANKHDSWLLTDDAHGLGITREMHKKTPHLQMGTLSKAVGSYGGYVCADKIIIDYLASAARSVVYSTGLPPSILAAGIASLKIIMADKELTSKPLQNAVLFTKMLGLDDAKSPIVPLILGSEEVAVTAAQELEKHGFLVSAIRPPTVSAGTSRLRFTFSALHKAEDIEKLVAVIKEIKLPIQKQIS